MIIWNVVLNGLIVTLWMGGLVFLIFKINPRYYLKGYPQDIKDMFPPQTEKEKNGFRMITFPGMLLMLAVITISTVLAYQGKEVSYWVLFFHMLIVLLIDNVLDMLIMDWLFICKLKLKIFILPGTEGNPYYDNYIQHFYGFLKGVVVSLFGAAVLAGITFWIL